MILRTLICAFTLLGCAAMHGQQWMPQNPYPREKLRVGFVFTDLISNRLRVDLDYRVEGSNTLGLGLGLLYGTEDMDNRVGESLRQAVGGFYVNASHKYYFAKSQKRRTYHFTRVTASYQSANVTYAGYGFVPYIDDGITYLNYQEIDQIYNAQVFGAQLEIGMEFIFDQFFTELSYGMKYSRRINNDYQPSQFRSGGRPFDIDYTGVAPTLAFKLGLYLD